MKNVCRSICSLLFVLICFGSVTMPACASNSAQSLAERGYPEEYINGLIDEQEDVLLELANEKDMIFIGIKELPDEYEETDMVLVYSAVLLTENDKTYIDRIIVTSDYRWRFVPEDLNRDTVAIIPEDSAFQFGTYFTSTDYMLDGDSLAWVSGKTIRQPNHVNEFELVYPVDLNFNGVKQERVSQLRGTAYFELIPTAPVVYDANTEFELNLGAYYNHSISASSVWQTDGPVAAGKYLVFVFGVLALPFLFCVINERMRKRIFKR